MSGMHSTFSNSVVGDKRHSYAVLSALQQGSAAEGSPAQPSSSRQQHPQYPKESDAASVSSFGSTVSLLKDKLHQSHNKSSSSNKSTSLVARQKAADDAKAQVLKNQSEFWSTSIRNDL
ncbi:uncharacterized protein CTRU02_202116 [Colletotrichum truncatum]|uniref:Uncharacterized protein n=1 Tax=Colletotrichum truncatum TaxID=5467 RepID=A0ACC3ZJG7_COLTU|nr:uncharacterized protein CTRU02_14264 [Colletotrichum truncatum]KAF6782371.1 hypothetical protein CTRU02_14264 [Colletotrichum truncatum]